jgi:UDP-N-acetylmuramate--alanine ligase
MHVFFSGIGGTGIGPLALIAHEAGFEVSGSDKQDSRYIHYLKEKGLTDIATIQTYDHMSEVHADNPIDWLVYTSALPIEHPDAPEIQFARDNNIRAGKRDDFLNMLLTEKQLRLIAIAGTHGKTTTTAMAIWVFKQLGIPVGYSVGAKISFGDMGHYEPGSKYFVYEADEFDRNFLSFRPYLSIITGIDWDHPDIYPTRSSYNEAFHTFLGQSEKSILWQGDVERLGISKSDQYSFLDENDVEISNNVTLAGKVNRLDAWEVAQSLTEVTGKPLVELVEQLNKFPGVSRRFEQIVPNLYSDYAHTPPKILGALQLAHETAGENVVVVYEGLHNTRQHFIKEDLKSLFKGVKQLYVVPSYLAREDKNLSLLTPSDIKDLLDSESQAHTVASELDASLHEAIANHLKDGDLVICLTAGGGGSLDEWLRQEFQS